MVRAHLAHNPISRCPPSPQAVRGYFVTSSDCHLSFQGSFFHVLPSLQPSPWPPPGSASEATQGPLPFIALLPGMGLQLGSLLEIAIAITCHEEHVPSSILYPLWLPLTLSSSLELSPDIVYPPSCPEGLAVSQSRGIV